MKNHISNKLYNKQNVAWDKKNDIRSILNDKGENIKIYEPNSDAMSLMAKYYELKYGVKIIFASTKEDLEGIKQLIQNSEESETACKFGFILPLVTTSGISKDSGHVCPVLYEKSSDGYSALISFDSVGHIGQHLATIDRMSNSTIPVYHSNVALQRSTMLCREFSVLMLKDALRMEDLVNELEFKESIYSADHNRLKILPDKLLKYAQTGTPLRTANVDTQIIRSHPEKEAKTLGQYRAENQKKIFLSNDRLSRLVSKIEDEEISEKSPLESMVNFKLLQENDLMMERIVKLCEFYDVTSDENLDELIQKVNGEKLTFPVKLPEKLPTWSKLQEKDSDQESSIKKSIFKETSIRNKYIYQQFCAVERDLKSSSQDKSDSAKMLLDPFACNVGKACLDLITKEKHAFNAYVEDKATAFCNMIIEMRDNNPSKAEEFISQLNEKIGTDLTSGSFKRNDKKPEKLMEYLRKLDFDQQQDPVRILISDLGGNDYPGSVEEQITFLLKKAAYFEENLKSLEDLKNSGEMSEIKASRRKEAEEKNQKKFISKISAKLGLSLAGLNLEVEDFNNGGSDRLKDAINLYKSSQGQDDFLIKELLDDDLLMRVNYRSQFPLQAYNPSLTIEMHYTQRKRDLPKISNELYDKLQQEQWNSLNEEEIFKIIEELKLPNEFCWISFEGQNLMLKGDIKHNFYSSGIGRIYNKGLSDLNPRELQDCLSISVEKNNEEVSGILQSLLHDKKEYADRLLDNNIKALAKKIIELESDNHDISTQHDFLSLINRVIVKPIDIHENLDDSEKSLLENPNYEKSLEQCLLEIIQEKYSELPPSKSISKANSDPLLDPSQPKRASTPCQFK